MADAAPATPAAEGTSSANVDLGKSPIEKDLEAQEASGA
jgi:hypothetical protein